MRILVTGGSGFLGGALVRAAHAAGHEVAVLTRSPAGASCGAHERIAGDLSSPPWTSIERFAPDACVHAAWIATPGVYLESAENHDWVRWSEAFVARLRGIGVRHVTVLGTCIEYRMTGGRLHESATPLAPISTYSRCKCELHGRLLERGFPSHAGLAWARIFYPYGEGEHPARLASSLMDRLRAGEPVRLRTPHSTKDYIHVTDVATALLTLVERQFGGTVNVGTGEGVTVESIARRLGAILGRPELVASAENPAPDPLDYVVADAGRLRSLGWSPQVTLEAGLRRLVEARGS